MNAEQIQHDIDQWRKVHEALSPISLPDGEVNRAIIECINIAAERAFTLTRILDASNSPNAVDMLQGLFIKWSRAQGYAHDSKRYRDFLDHYAACYHDGLLPSTEP